MKTLLTGTTLVLPGADLVLGFMERMEEFAAQPGREIFARALEYRPEKGSKHCGINRTSVAELLAAMYLEELQGTSKWAQITGCENYVEQQWIKMVPGWKDHVSGKLENKMHFAVVQEAYEEIHDWVCNFDDGQPGWHVWYVRRLGLDIMIEKGPDFRLLDWTRRMEQGAAHLKAKQAGETLPAGAWVPDAEGQRFAELLMSQQRKPSGLGRSSVDAYDQVQREARTKRLEGSRRRLLGRVSRRGKGVL